jgi:hypothetical protein
MSKFMSKFWVFWVILGRCLTASSQAAIHSMRVHLRILGAFLPLTILSRRGVIVSPSTYADLLGMGIADKS